MATKQDRKVLITGDRHWTDLALIQHTLEEYGATAIVEGEAPGADILSRQAGEALGLEIHKHEAQWTRYGRAAGPIRNREMLNDHRDAAFCLAFHDDLFKGSKGTYDMVFNVVIPAHMYCILTEHVGRKHKHTKLGGPPRQGRLF